MQIQSDISLKDYNTFGIKASARYFTEVQSPQQLRELIISDLYKNNPVLILGGGSNILFTKDFEGLVVKMGIKGLEKVKEDESEVWIKAGAGENWHQFVLYCIENGLGGIENLSLIPGTVGAAPMQNIGAYGVEIKEVLEGLEAMDIATGEIKSFRNDDCQFGYRQSVFKHELKGKYIIISVTFRLQKKHTFNVSYGAIKDTIEAMGIKELSIKAISDAVIFIRKSKLPDPEVIGNAGSFFKNPEIQEVKYNTLKETYPTIPGYPTLPGWIKVPAGWLIEQAGWKGKRVGETGVHKNQALVLVNYGNANGKEIQHLSAEVQKSVREKFGIDIVAEVNIV
ncbi:MAG TPA: UDP-N-acetylmuramate dehydrogenase [Cytophagales bacterium]|nr:UDP-N-acetylmuramate dehydrogenase [Cytophagales bacterium]